MISEEDYKKALTLIESFRIEQNGVPCVLKNPNFNQLKETTQKYIELLQIGKIGDDDFKEEIFIAAIESIFGKEVWVWVEKHTKTRKG